MMSNGTQRSWITGDSDGEMVNDRSIIQSIVLGLLGLLVFLILQFGFRWRHDIKKRLRQLQEDSWFFGAKKSVHPLQMARDPEMQRPAQSMKVLELNPLFCNENKDWRFLSLGQYLAQLRPAMIPESMSPDELPNWIQEELDGTSVIS